MISRIYVRCLTCSGAVTARVQIGHESTQPVTFPCPHCASEIRIRLLLDKPPNVDIAWEENCEEGDVEGLIVNIGAGFAIAKDKVHQDIYFPSMEMHSLLMKRLAETEEKGGKAEGDRLPMRDTMQHLGTIPHIQESWKIAQKAWHLHRTGRVDLRDAQIEQFWSRAEHNDRSIEHVLLSFFTSFLEPRADVVIPPLLSLLDDAYKANPTEVRRLGDALENHWISDRIDSYIELLREFFKGYGDFSQTLVYVKMGEPLGSEGHGCARPATRFQR